MPNPVPAWALPGAEIIVVEPKHNGSFTNRGRDHDIAWVGKIERVTLAGVIHVTHGPQRVRGCWKTYTAASLHAEHASTNEPSKHGLRTSRRIVPATLANVSNFNAAMRAFDEIEAKRIREAEASRAAEAEREALRQRRVVALLTLQAIEGLDVDQREALEWAQRELARDPGTTL